MDSPLDQERPTSNVASSSPGETVAAGVPAAAPPAVKPPLPPIAKTPRAAGAVVESAPEPAVNKMRRRIVWASVVGFLTTCFLMFLRFFLPRSILEPSSKFSVGFPSDYALGVDTKWQQQYRIWVDKTPDRLFVIYARCTHLGCTPDWKASENKFKCPCHGSGYRITGVNFEGPTPRPLERARVALADDGQILVDKSKHFQYELGQWADPESFLKA